MKKMKPVKPKLEKELLFIGKPKDECMRNYIEAAKEVLEEEEIRKQMRPYPKKFFQHKPWVAPTRPDGKY